jgi:hypothetical protein
LVQQEALVVGRIGLFAMLLGQAAGARSYTPPNRVIVTADASMNIDAATGLHRYAYVFRCDPSSPLEVSTLFLPLGGAAVQGVAAPSGWSVGYSVLDDAITFDATEVAVPPGHVDDGSIPPGIAQIKPGHALGGFSILSPNRPGTVFFHAQGFTQPPVVDVDLDEPDEPGGRLPGPLDPTESFRGSTIGPVRAAPGEPVALTYFLHGEPRYADPARLFLNLVVPTNAAAKHLESEGVRFANGNPWVTVGTWVASGPSQVGTLTGSGGLDVWLALKDQTDVGTQFDMKAVVARNGAVIGSGSISCVTGMVHGANPDDPSAAREVTIPVAVPQLVGFASSDTLSVQLATRIGTNPDGSMCPGRDSASGLRVYFDATSQAARLPLLF